MLRAVRHNFRVFMWQSEFVESTRGKRCVLLVSVNRNYRVSLSSGSALSSWHDTKQFVFAVI